MLDAETLEKLHQIPPTERLALIETLLQSLKPAIADSPPPERPAFGFMQDTGEILGDVITPVLPETSWSVLT